MLFYRSKNLFGQFHCIIALKNEFEFRSPGDTYELKKVAIEQDIYQHKLSETRQYWLNAPNKK